MSVSFVTREPIALDALIAEVAAPAHGAITSFLGTVRAGPEDGPVVHIEYTAYEAMLEQEFRKILDDAAARWADVAVVARHRLGEVRLGEASMAIVTAAPHRAAALDACRFVIEEAKRRLPVWKREILADGTAAWRDNAGGRVQAGPASPEEP